tara:strand:+ start:1671 stop:2375 length:705 start_codon:yes stop_codon:yes gene_type:complete
MKNTGRPWDAYRLGPVILRTRISDHLHTILLNASNKIRKSKKLKLKNDYRKNLAGNLTEEYNFNNAFSPQAEKIVDEELIWLAQNYTKTCSELTFRKFTIQKKNIVILKPGWVNFMKPGEWNPSHTHTGSISCVLFLKVPEEIELENKQSELSNKSNTPTAGRLEFTYGENIGFTPTGSLRVPKEKDIYFFPARLNHMVYPFKSNVERVSVSFNFADRTYAETILEGNGEAAWD